MRFGESVLLCTRFAHRLRFAIRMIRVVTVLVSLQQLMTVGQCFWFLPASEPLVFTARVAAVQFDAEAYARLLALASVLNFEVQVSAHFDAEICPPLLTSSVILLHSS
jgi:hypothetical protein